VCASGGGSLLGIAPARVALSRGGEAIDLVLGRSEDAELPVFSAGGVVLHTPGQSAAGGGVVQQARVFGAGGSGLQVHESMKARDPFKMRMLDGLAVSAGTVTSTGAPPAVCSQVVDEPVIFLTRVEYANLFHTTTDWYNTWQAARMFGLEPSTDYDVVRLGGLTPESRHMQAKKPRSVTRRIPAHIVFLDGHNAASLDDGWMALFWSINYIKHFDVPQQVCFRRAVFAPFGYHASISAGFIAMPASCNESPYIAQFGEDFVRGFAMEPLRQPMCTPGADGKVKVLFVRRVHYMAHPRHNGQIVRRLDNEDDIFQVLSSAAEKTGAPFSLLNGVFSSMTLAEQLRMALDSCVIMGAHGAGLSHILFMAPGAHVLELQPPAFVRPHFVAYSNWAGLSHDAWMLDSSTPTPTVVLERLEKAVFQLTNGGITND
jgi:glycoprotein 2-beta-D-xylosyltransferase